MSLSPDFYAEQSTSSSMLQGARAGETEAWEEVVEKYSPLIYNQCRSMGLSPDEAADVAQETFAAAARNIGRYQKRREMDGFRKWLRGVARNKTRDLFRRQQKQLAEAQGGTNALRRLQEVTCEPSSAPDAGDATLRVRRALAIIEDDFQPNTWAAFWQTAIRERSSIDVAKELQMTPEAVRKAKSRILKRLETELKQAPDLTDAMPPGD
jgi:RNA polymerase sigma-70 factor (ECF subfamily)